MQETKEPVHPFTYDHFKKIILLAKEQFSNIVPVKIFFQNSATDSESTLILRHDIDFSISQAVEMALIEQELKVISSYFFLTNSAYDIKQHIPEINKIVKMGHEIGLHFDVNAKDSTGKIIGLSEQVEYMESTLDIKINSVSAHNPTLNGFTNDNSYYSAYDSSIFTPETYVSDSSRRWRYGCFCNRLEQIVKECYKLKIPAQLLIHPIWWHQRNMSAHDALVNAQVSSDIIDMALNDISKVLQKEQNI